MVFGTFAGLPQLEEHYGEEEFAREKAGPGCSFLTNSN